MVKMVCGFRAMGDRKRFRQRRRKESSQITSYLHERRSSCYRAVEFMTTLILAHV